MDKLTPHHSLDEIKRTVANKGADCFTRTALDGARKMGLDTAQAIAALSLLDRKHFFKSMTTYADHRVWQDVYHAPTPCGVAYVKFILRSDGSVVVSFKEL